MAPRAGGKGYEYAHAVPEVDVGLGAAWTPNSALDVADAHAPEAGWSLLADRIERVRSGANRRHR